METAYETDDRAGDQVESCLYAALLAVDGRPWSTLVLLREVFAPMNTRTVRRIAIGTVAGIAAAAVLDVSFWRWMVGVLLLRFTFDLFDDFLGGDAARDYARRL